MTKSPSVVGGYFGSCAKHTDREAIAETNPRFNRHLEKNRNICFTSAPNSKNQSLRNNAHCNRDQATTFAYQPLVLRSYGAYTASRYTSTDCGAFHAKNCHLSVLPADRSTDCSAASGQFQNFRRPAPLRPR